MAQIIWTESALSDLEAIADYIALDHPAAAAAVVQRVFEHVGQLAAHPDSGAKPPELNRSRYRQLVTTPCRILYRHDTKKRKVYILHIIRFERLLHGGVLRSREKETKQR